ncbi:MAG: YidB family protein [Gammaproteobacteria bacterium]
MDLGKLASQMLMSKLGGSADEGAAASALNSLIGSGDSVNLGDVVQKLQGRGGDMAAMAQSWLGDGDNMPISGSQITELLGSGQVQEFAAKMGLNQNQASEGLASMLPNLIDKTSSGGSLLDSVGGLSGVAGMASKFFK